MSHPSEAAPTSFRDVPVTHIYRREDVETAWYEGYESAMLDVANDGQETENPYRDRS